MEFYLGSLVFNSPIVFSLPLQLLMHRTSSGTIFNKLHSKLLLLIYNRSDSQSCMTTSFQSHKNTPKVNERRGKMIKLWIRGYGLLLRSSRWVGGENNLKHRTIPLNTKQNLVLFLQTLNNHNFFVPNPLVFICTQRY